MFIKKNNKILYSTILLSLMSSTAYASVSGTVFQDLPVNKIQLNTYGVKDTNEQGVAGVTVTAFPDNISTTTDASGAWSLSTSGDSRIEFSNIPAYLKESPNAKVNNALVQFTGNGGVVNLGLHDVNDYSETAQPIYATNIFSGGSGVGNNLISLVRNNYTDTGLSSDFKTYDGDAGTGPVSQSDATIGEIGSVWGKGYQMSKKRMFMASMLWRHIGFASGGPSKIWVKNYADNSLASLDLQGQAGIDLGLVKRTGGSDFVLPADGSNPSVDLDAYSKVGKISFGDLDVDNSTNMAWAINLNQKALISMDISGATGGIAATAKQYLLADMGGVPACTGGELRPWGLGIHEGKGYVGSVCDASTSQDKADLKAYVSTFDLVNPITLTTVLAIDMGNYRNRGHGGLDSADEDRSYLPWSDEVHDTSGNWDFYAQPILTDIDFDAKGNMYLGFIDRYGLQLGYDNYTAKSGSTTISEKAYGQGEIFKVCNSNGSYELEGTGTCSKGKQKDGDFFNDLAGDWNANASGGAMVILKGSKELLLVVIDPHPNGVIGEDYWNTSGVETFSTEDGKIKNWYSHLYSGDIKYTGKAAGQGDIELLTAPAPIEVGDRVWLDSNSDGIQDADEKGIESVKVELVCEGQVKATATTDNRGTFIFSNDPSGTSTASHIYAVADLVEGNTNNCLIRIPDITTQVAIGTNNPSTVVVAKPLTNSDGVANGDNVEAAILATDIPVAGANNHSFDFGFTPALGCMEGSIFKDVDNDTVFNGADLKASGIGIYLVDSSSKRYDVVSDALGAFNFANIPVGSLSLSVDYNDADIPEGATWLTTLPIQVTVNQGTACTTQDIRFTTPDAKIFDPKSIATCANPTSITWEGSTVSSMTEGHDIASLNTKAFQTVGGKEVGVTFSMLDTVECTRSTHFNNAQSGTFGGANENGTDGVFGAAYLTSYLGIQLAAGNADLTDTISYKLPAGDCASMTVEFSESVILDNWRVKDIDSGDIRDGVNNWDWQDAVKYEGFDRDGNSVFLEAKLSEKTNLILDANGYIHTDGVNNPAILKGTGSEPYDTRGQAVYTSNGIPVKKIIITHKAGPDVANQTRSALAVGGFAVCKPLHISGTVYQDGNAERPEDGTETNIACGDVTQILYAKLVNTTNRIIDIVPVKDDGTYLFEKNILPNSNYVVQLDSTFQAIGDTLVQTSLPASCNYIGESLSTDPLNSLDTVTDGKIPVEVASESVENLNFGLNAKPIAHSYESPAYINPGGTVQRPLTMAPYCDIGGFIKDNESKEMKKIQILSLPTVSSGILYYNGVAVVKNDIIENTDACGFTFDPADGDVKVTFQYRAIDEAGVSSDLASVSANYHTLHISGKLFNDGNANGNIDGNSTDVACKDTSVPLYVNLIGNNGKVLDSQTFSPNTGAYDFGQASGVAADSSYEVVLSQTKANKGDVAPATTLPSGCTNADGEAIGLTGTDGTADGKIVVNVAQKSVSEVNFGIGKVASLGNYVWYDVNQNGIQDAGELPAKDVTVKLLKECTTVMETTITDANGNYLFKDLVPGDYCVEFVLPVGYALTTKDGGDDTKDSDVSKENPKTEKTTLIAGENDLTWDAGLYKLSSLGDYVWYDENHDGKQDADEPAVEDVKVTLYESDCTTAISETRSDANGKYLFENLEPKEYCVGFDELPVGYQFTPNYDNSGAGSELDCNVDPGTGKTPVITLPHATDDMTWDMGIIPKCKDEENRVLYVYDDNVTASTTGSVTTVNILANDHGNLDIESIKFVTSQEAKILWENGTAVGGVSLETTDKLVVKGEGNWTISNDGTISFKAEDGFTGVPSPVYYVINCKQGNTSNVGKVEITSNCVCDTYEQTTSDSVAIFSNISMVLVLMLTSILGGFLFRKELTEKLQ